MAERKPIDAGCFDTVAIRQELKIAEDLAGNDRVLKFAQMQASKMNTGPTFDRNEKVPGTKLFDNLYYFGNQEVGSFVFDTGEGLIMIDSCFPAMLDEILLGGMKEFNLDPKDIKYLFITHPGPDHAGTAYYFQQNFGTKVMMSRIEKEKHLPSDEENKERIEARKRPDFVYDQFNLGQVVMPVQSEVGVVEDGDTITLGNTTITAVYCPRSVRGGGTSYLATVYDNGVPHIFATYGNTNVTGNLDDMVVYRESVKHFMEYCEKLNADVIISNHPFVDGSVTTMKELRARKPGDPNPFVFGHEKVMQFLRILDRSSVVIAMRRSLGYNEAGCGIYVRGVMDLANNSINTTPKDKQLYNR